MATLLPAGGRRAYRTAPAPVCTPQPNGPRMSRGVSRDTTTRARSSTTVCVDPATDDVVEAIRRASAGGVDCSVETTGNADVLRSAGVADADAVVVATNGDNTNLVIGQVVKKRYGVDCVVVRILDPARAEFYSDRGMQVVCPTKTAISSLADTVKRTTAAVAR